MNYTIVKYRETLYGHHTALTSAVVKTQLDTCTLLQEMYYALNTQRLHIPQKIDSFYPRKI